MISEIIRKPLITEYAVISISFKQWDKFLAKIDYGTENFGNIRVCVHSTLFSYTIGFQHFNLLKILLFSYVKSPLLR